jgi:hypothetical protein
MRGHHPALDKADRLPSRINIANPSATLVGNERVQQVEPVPLVSLDKQGAALHGVIFPLPRSGCHSLPDVY